MAMNLGGKGGAKADINVTPLIDIVLVLLIVFIVMVPGLSKAAPVVVPNTTSVPPKDIPKNLPTPLVVTVTKDGKFLLQQDEVDLKVLADQLFDVIKNQPITDRKVTLKVDEDLQFRRRTQSSRAT